MEQVTTEGSIDDDRLNDSTDSECHEEIPNVSLWRYLWDEINRGQV